MDLLSLFQAIASFSALLIIYHLIITWTTSNNSMRPGPPEPAGRLPIIGHLHLLMRGPGQLLGKLGAMADQYGPTLMVGFGMHRMLVVSSYEAVKDCFTTNDKALSSRPNTAVTEHMGYNHAMFGLAPYGPYWREVHKIVMLQILSNTRLKELKHVRATEIDSRVKHMYRLWSMNAVPIDLKQWCGEMTLNIVCRMVVGKRCFNYSHHDDGNGGGDDDRDGRRFRKAITQFFNLLGVFVVSDVVPFLKWFDFQGHKRAMKAAAKEMDSLLSMWLDEHRKRRSLAEGEVTNEDFMDVMLSIIEDDHISGYDRDTTIKATCLSIILGGTEGTSGTLSRAISFVLTNPHVLKKAQQELDIHVGKDRNVDESDIANLVYLQAILKETLRLTPDSSVSLSRVAMQDCQVDGYHVPAGTRVMVNTWKLHRDPRVWSDPNEFRPERFLTSHAGVEPKGQNFEYIPFGSGRRACPGLSFALQVIHLALARVIHSFDVAAISQVEPLKMGVGSGSSDPVQVLFSPRLSPELYR
ncbi:hypothetical protein AAC387_Pa04g2219 [Persea americana]